MSTAEHLLSLLRDSGKVTEHELMLISAWVGTIPNNFTVQHCGKTSDDSIAISLNNIGHVIGTYPFHSRVVVDIYPSGEVVVLWVSEKEHVYEYSLVDLHDMWNHMH